MTKKKLFNKADELYDSIAPIQRKIRKNCEKYIKSVLEENDGHIDFDECNEAVSVSYDGGNHPEYASSAYSTVYNVFLDNHNDIVLEIEDCDEYPIENLSWDEVFWVADLIAKEIDVN